MVIRYDSSSAIPRDALNGEEGKLIGGKNRAGDSLWTTSMR